MLPFVQSAEDPLTVGNLIMDRRQEPRFELRGHFHSLTPAGLVGRVVDLSLNGALLECDTEPQCAAGESVDLLLEFDLTRPFAAQVRVAHVHGMRVGIEFQEIEPVAFELLSDLVLALRRAPALARLNGGS